MTLKKDFQIQMMFYYHLSVSSAVGKMIDGYCGIIGVSIAVGRTTDGIVPSTTYIVSYPLNDDGKKNSLTAFVEAIRRSRPQKRYREGGASPIPLRLITADDFQRTKTTTSTTMMTKTTMAMGRAGSS